MPDKTIAILLPDMGIGGAERVALRLTRSFLEAGQKVHLVLMQKRGELLEEVPPEVQVFDLGARRVRQSIRPLTHYLKTHRPDAVQARMWPLTVAAIIARRLAKSSARLVVSDHNILSIQYPAGSPARAFLRVSTRLFYPLADVRLAVAQPVADDLARLSGIPRERFEVVPNPVGDPPADLQTPAAVEALWGAAGARLVMVGLLASHKNQALLIRSFARLLQQRPDAKLMLVGEGPLKEDLRTLARELGIEDRVIFAGFRADPWPFYASADLFVLSSDREGHPNVLVEALQAGTPVVATDSGGGTREILDDGRFGRLVPVGNEIALAEAMDDALSSPTPRQLLLERAAALSGPAAARRYLELLLGETVGRTSAESVEERSVRRRG
jgi:glycosyltransferase involved in cell wall biosynthesis